MIIAGVAFAIPTKIIFAHIGLFEFLDSDSFPKPPKLSKAQSELLAASIVGLVWIFYDRNYYISNLNISNYC